MSDKNPKVVRYGPEDKNLNNMKNKEIYNKWGEDVIDRGFSQIPFYLLNINRYLEPKLSSLQLLILVQLVSNWWKKGENPYPSMKHLGERCGVSERQIQRSIDVLVERGIIEKKKILSSNGVVKRNSYSLNNLTSLLKDISRHHPRIK